MRSDQGDRRWSFVNFPTTEWTVVVQAGEGALSALERLCTRYRAPLLTYLALQGISAEDAEDLLQGFLKEKLSEPGFLRGLDQERGQFRVWVRRSLRNLLRDDERHKAAAKRGHGQVHVPLDPVTGEHAPGQAVVDRAITPDEAFDRTWATTLLANAFGRLKKEYAQRGKADWYDLFEPVLYSDDGALPYRDIAARIGKTESGARSAASRARARMRFLIWDEVARTVSEPAAVETELRHLLQSLSR